MIHTLYLTNHHLKKTNYDSLVEYFSNFNLKPYKQHNYNYFTSYYSDIGISRIILKTTKIVRSRKQQTYYQVDLQINPSKFINKGRFDIILKEDIELLNDKFNNFIDDINNSIRNKAAEQEIILPHFYNWTTNRIDYAVQFRVDNVSEYIELFQRGDKPHVFKKDGVYVKSTSNRYKQRKGSMYYRNNSVTINFYNKEYDVKYNKDNVSEEELEDVKNIIRFEVQCKKPKTNNMKYKYSFNNKELYNYLREEESKKTILDYYDKTVGAGDYYTLEKAIDIISKSSFRASYKVELINNLYLISQTKSIWKVRDRIEEGIYISKLGITIKKKKQTFNSQLNSIRELGINPVTIPNRWGIEKLENLRDKIVSNF